MTYNPKVNNTIMLVYPAHDYNSMTVSNIGEGKRYNPRLQVHSQDEYVEMINSLKNPDPTLLDMAVAANRACGKTQAS